MDYCCKSRFWIGLGLGAVLGVVCCRYARTQHAKELKGKVCDAMHKMGEKTNEMWNSAKEKVAENGAKLADKMQEFGNAKN